MTPAEVRRMQQDAARQAKEQLKEQQRQEREDAAAQKRLKAEQVRAERERQRTINSTIRAGEHMATSRLGQDVIRGVFGTLFGGGRK
jgi:methylmalonyl-CoA mutase N-terminal domain/subunit